MTFRVSARTVLQLGAELISSDAVAFYELIKNAFDAGSPKVSIHVVIRLPEEAIRGAHDFISIGSNSHQALLDCTQSLIARLDLTTPSADILRNRLATVKSQNDLQSLLDEANFIEIIDTGSGMSLKELDDIFLTIGTRARLKERTAKMAQSAAKRPILGEKGLGRLSAMRLGWKLQVVSSKRGEQNWNVLDIDWRLFSHASDAMLEEIDIVPVKGEKKTDSGLSGTRLRISALTTGWDESKVQDIAVDQFSKLTDPFAPDSRYPIAITFNDRLITIPGFDTVLHRYASAEVYAEFRPDSPTGPRLTGRINYKLRNREKTFELEGAHLISSVKLPTFHVLRALGPFDAQFVWFNRKALREMEEDVGEVRRVIKLQEKWAGGLMVYRDGFRVYPYGSPDDDWLDLDKKALSSGGYKVNRRQVIGKVNISSASNPALLDQSNREGLRDCSEKQSLILLLKYVLESEFRPFLTAVDKEVRATEPTTFDDLAELIDESQGRIAESLRGLVIRHPAVAEDGEIITVLQDAIKDIRRRLEDAKTLAESFELKHAQVVHLAATGLLVEMLAHELNRATENALATLMDAGRQKLIPQGAGFLTTLQAELKTLQRRLRILDPLSTTGRQRKEVFELVEWVKDVMTTHSPQLERHGITCVVSAKPVGGTLRIKAVKGSIVQILGNLVANSAYWLKQERKIDRQLKPEIVVIVDTKRKAISFSDNGPGIPVARKTEVFQPFVTTKPPGEGKGLGLYIAREIARYNNAALTIAKETTVHADRLNTFLLTLDGVKE